MTGRVAFPRPSDEALVLHVFLTMLGLFGVLMAVAGHLGLGALCVVLTAAAVLAVPGMRAEPTATPRGREAARLADIIVNQVLFDRFDLSDAELEALAAVLPEPVRGPAPFWFLLHGGWLVREAARDRHGAAFVDEIHAAMRARLRLNGGNFDGPHWFTTLDTAFTRSDAALRHHEDDDPSPSLRVARSLLAVNDSSPYGGRLSVPPDVDTQLAACLQALENHLAPAIDVFVYGAPRNVSQPEAPASVDSGPSADVGGPREHHLRRRQDNLLFPPPRRLVTPEQLGQARADDAQEFDILHSRALDALSVSLDDADAFDASHCKSRLDDFAALIAACTHHGSAPAIALRDQCRMAALGLVAAARQLQSTSPDAAATWQGWLDSEESRFQPTADIPETRTLLTVPREDIPATVCAMGPDGIRRLAAHMGMDSDDWQQLVPLCRERLEAAAQEGYPEAEATERLAALGVA